MSPPELSIICRTHGGPTTSVLWYLPNNDFVNVELENYTNYETSTVVISTSHNCVYENRLRVRGISGNYSGIFTYTLLIHYYQTIDSVFGMINVLGKRIIS